MCNTLNAYHVQYDMCHVVRKDSSAVKFNSLNHINFGFILLAETMKPVKKVRKPEFPEKNPDDKH